MGIGTIRDEGPILSDSENFQLRPMEPEKSSVPSVPELAFYDEVSEADLPKPLVISKAKDDHELFEFFALLEIEYTDNDTNPDVIVAEARRSVEKYREDSTKEGISGKEILVVKDGHPPRVVAGTMTWLMPSTAGNRVFLKSMVVHPKLRRQKIGSNLLDAQIERSKQDADTAFALVYFENYASLANAFGHGFQMEDDPDPDWSRKLYGNLTIWYLSKDLKGNEVPAAISHDKDAATEIITPEGLPNAGSPIAIQLTNVESIRSALKQGYKGRAVFERTNGENAKLQMLYLEKQ